jgi:hypothetical protein
MDINKWQNAINTRKQCPAQGGAVNPPVTNSVTASVQTTSASLPVATSAVNNNTQPKTNVTVVNTATTNTGNKRTDIFSQGRRMFTCSLGFLEVCEGTDSSKCSWKTGTAQDLTQYRLGMEESAKRAEKSAREFDKAFGPKATASDKMPKVFDQEFKHVKSNNDNKHDCLSWNRYV